MTSTAIGHLFAGVTIDVASLVVWTVGLSRVPASIGSGFIVPGMRRVARS